MESRDLIRFGPKHNATNPSLQMQFDFDGPAGLRDRYSCFESLDRLTYARTPARIPWSQHYTLVFIRSMAANSVVGDGILLIYSAFIFRWLFFILAGNKTNHESLDEFELQQDSITELAALECLKYQ